MLVILLGSQFCTARPEAVDETEIWNSEQSGSSCDFRSTAGTCAANAGTFRADIPYYQAGVGVGNKPSGIVVADLNGDGILDLAVANESDDTVSVVLSRPNGSFVPKVDYNVGAAPVALV